MISIAIGCDHAGYEYKENLKKLLCQKGYSVVDMGTDSIEAVNYPVYANNVCDQVVCKNVDFGILICGTGIGMSIVANKHKGIRAALCNDTKSATLTREHNDANVLCMGERILSYESVVAITEAFLAGKFIGGKHQIRLDMIAELEK